MPRTKLICSGLVFFAVLMLAGGIWAAAVPDNGIVFNDVSRLNPVVVQEVFQPTTELELIDKILEAQKLNLKISIAGKRHSQGGQQSCPGCLVIDMLKFNKILALDTEKKIIRVQSGATWDQIQRHIDPYGLALKVMQTSNIFTVGGSLSANVHGRDARYGNMRNAVRSFRLLLADGRVVTVSRNENPELFKLAIGGLGLLGIVLDVEIELTENVVYKKQAVLMDYAGYPAYLQNSLQNDPDMWLHFGTLSIAPGDSFLREMMVFSYKTSDQELIDSKLIEETNVLRDKFLFGLSRRFAWGKILRWSLQKKLGLRPGYDEYTTRNNAMRPPIRFLDYDSPADTDILQEYFVPIDRFQDFVDGLRRIVLEEHINLLHVGVRYVPADRESYLSYAPQDSIALVLYMNQGLSDEGREAAQGWTRQLVDLVFGCGGTYYLVYQLYPTKEQLQKVYPKISQFFDQKRVFDPQLRFMNQFYQRYAL